ncbi:MAG: FISUMP domain-containing protein [Flavobacteriaceae bacterium]
MTKTTFLFIIFTLITTPFLGQTETITLNFDANISGEPIQVESILVENLTQGGTTELFPPNFELQLKYEVLNIPDFFPNPSKGINLTSFPNPITTTAQIKLHIYQAGPVTLAVYNALGQRLVKTTKELAATTHTFEFQPGKDKIYFVVANTQNHQKVIKILSQSTGQEKLALDDLKSSERSFPKSSTKSANLPFDLGDELSFTAFSAIGQQTLIDSPTQNTTYIFEYIAGMPCPDTPTVMYQGQLYNTVLIGSQCWLKENLNAGTMINGDDTMTDNGVLEKWCYNNDEANCDEFGAFYQWHEMMQYSINEGVQGICPEGWHLPTDDEWLILESTVDSQYGYDDEEWHFGTWRGFDAGKHLKSDFGWEPGFSGNGSDVYGFRGLPAGKRSVLPFESFQLQGFIGTWWTSTKADSYGTYAFYRHLDYNAYGDGIWRSNEMGIAGRCVRCIKDE